MILRVVNDFHFLICRDVNDQYRSFFIRKFEFDVCMQLFASGLKIKCLNVKLLNDYVTDSNNTYYLKFDSLYQLGAGWTR